MAPGSGPREGSAATPRPTTCAHYFASVQIRGGESIKVLQALLGHKSAVETWDTYGHLMGDEDDRSRAVIDAALGARTPGAASAATGDNSEPHRTAVAEKVSTVEPQ